MKLGEIVVYNSDNYNFTTFHQNQMKNRKVFLIAHHIQKLHKLRSTKVLYLQIFRAYENFKKVIDNRHNANIILINIIYIPLLIRPKITYVP